MKTTFLTLFMASCMYLQSQTATPVSSKDQKFTEMASDANMLEIKLGQLAVSKGQSEQVRTLGQHMIDDHTKAGAELTSIAAKKGIVVPADLSAKSQRKYDKLSKKEGSEFDKAYAKCMVKDHKMVISLFKKESEKGEDAELKSFASTTIPTLEHHRMMSEGADKVLNP